MRIVLAAALFFIPSMIHLGVASWLAQFRTDALVREDSGLGRFLAARRARNTPANYTPEGRKRLPLLWVAGLVQVIGLLAAMVVLAS